MGRDHGDDFVIHYIFGVLVVRVGASIRRVRSDFPAARECCHLPPIAFATGRGSEGNTQRARSIFMGF